MATVQKPQSHKKDDITQQHTDILCATDCICPSKVSQNYIKMAEKIELFFAYRLPSVRYYIVLQGNLGISKKEYLLSSRTLSETLDLADFSAFFLHNTSTVVLST